MRAQPTIAIVHDWLYGGGAEQVILTPRFIPRTARERGERSLITRW